MFYWIENNYSQLTVFISFLSLFIAALAYWKSRKNELLTTSIFVFDRFNSERMVEVRHSLKHMSSTGPIDFVAMTEEQRAPYKEMVLLICMISSMIENKQVDKRLVLSAFATPVIRAIERLEPYLETRNNALERKMIQRKFRFLSAQARAIRRAF